MVLTPIMAAAGIAAGLMQWVAHQLVRDRVWATPIARYTIGVTIALLTFSLAYATDSRQDAITGVWYVFGASAVGTWLGYIGDPAPAFARTSADDLERWAAVIAEEHRSDESD